MDPRHPSFVVEPEPEEPIEATDYYEAVQMGWLSLDAGEDVEQATTPVRPPSE